MIEQTQEEQQEVALLVDSRLRNLRRDAKFFPDLSKYVDEVERARSSTGKSRIVNIEIRLLHAEKECARMWAKYAEAFVDEKTNRKLGDDLRKKRPDPKKIKKALKDFSTRQGQADHLGIDRKTWKKIREEWE